MGALLSLGPAIVHFSGPFGEQGGHTGPKEGATHRQLCRSTRFDQFRGSLSDVLFIDFRQLLWTKVFLLNGIPVYTRAPFWKVKPLRIHNFCLPGSGCKTDSSVNAHGVPPPTSSKMDGPSWNWLPRFLLNAFISEPKWFQRQLFDPG